MQLLIRIASYVLLGAALVIAVITGRLVSDGKHHFEEALRLEDAGDRDGAVTSLEDAAKAYVPGSPYTERALRELTIMARAAEMRGDRRQSAGIWEVVRRSVLATRHFYQPNEDVLTMAEKQLGRLMGEQFPQAAETHLVARPADPSPVGSVILFLGLALWIACALWISVDPRLKDGRPIIPGLYLWGGCLAGIGVWVVMAWLI